MCKFTEIFKPSSDNLSYYRNLNWQDHSSATSVVEAVSSNQNSKDQLIGSDSNNLSPGFKSLPNVNTKTNNSFADLHKKLRSRNSEQQSSKKTTYNQKISGDTFAPNKIDQTCPDGTFAPNNSKISCGINNDSTNNLLLDSDESDPYLNLNHSDDDASEIVWKIGNPLSTNELSSNEALVSKISMKQTSNIESPVPSVKITKTCKNQEPRRLSSEKILTSSNKKIQILLKKSYSDDVLVSSSSTSDSSFEVISSISSNNNSSSSVELLSSNDSNHKNPEKLKSKSLTLIDSNDFLDSDQEITSISLTNIDKELNQLSSYPAYEDLSTLVTDNIDKSTQINQWETLSEIQKDYLDATTRMLKEFFPDEEISGYMAMNDSQDVTSRAQRILNEILSEVLENQQLMEYEPMSTILLENSKPVQDFEDSSSLNSSTESTMSLNVDKTSSNIDKSSSSSKIPLNERVDLNESVGQFEGITISENFIEHVVSDNSSDNSQSASKWQDWKSPNFGPEDLEAFLNQNGKLFTTELI